ncbi:uncharacterized protein [Antedon mediterranea]|uniref:uncharacterized protein n=1 Tax=Antedon mediterranea TaxID=105859 RepID=UPI003AF7D785
MTSGGGKKVQATTHHFSVPGLYGKDSLSADDQELYELCNLSGVNLSPAVYKILMDLLKMNVSPVAITQMLKTMTHGSGLSLSQTSLLVEEPRKAPSSTDLTLSQTLVDAPSKVTSSSSRSSSASKTSKSRNSRSSKPRDSQK